MYTFRFDDISLNTDATKLRRMIDYLRRRFTGGDLSIMLAVSPTVYDMSKSVLPNDRERVFPPMLHTKSDFREFYKPDRIGIPDVVWELRPQPDITLAAHGIVHVDHRLLKRSAQEMSILLSCALVKCNAFVPPFHKWNKRTQAVCDEHGIALIKYDHTWAHLAYNPFVETFRNYYLHTHDFTYESFCARFS